MIGLSHYRIVEPLGAGGTAIDRARDEKAGPDVAVKVLSADALADESARWRSHGDTG